jgi:glyoxylase-like metal-dependent hydrolase (beta-lactamase superfamily II)
VPVAAADPAWCRNAEPLHDNDLITSGGLSIEVLATPGHTSDSVCLVVSAGSQRAVCAGDTILGRGTTIVAWPDGNLADYLSSLDRLAEFDGVPVLTGHGPVLPDCGEIARDYRAHRNERLVQVRAAISAGARTPTEIVAEVYPDLEDGLAAAAESQVRAALAYLQPDGVLLPDSAAAHDGAVPHAAARDGAVPHAAAPDGVAKADAAEVADVVMHPEPAPRDST